MTSRRKNYVVKSRDSLVSVAEEKLFDARLAWLILQMNVKSVSHVLRGNICVVTLIAGQTLELPSPLDVKLFRVQEGKYPDIDYLVTVVDVSQYQKDVLVGKLRDLITGPESDGQPDDEGATDNVIVVNFDRAAVAVNDGAAD